MFNTVDQKQSMIKYTGNIRILGYLRCPVCPWTSGGWCIYLTVSILSENPPAVLRWSEDATRFLHLDRNPIHPADVQTRSTNFFIFPSMPSLRRSGVTCTDENALLTPSGEALVLHQATTHLILVSCQKRRSSNLSNFLCSLSPTSRDFNSFHELENVLKLNSLREKDGRVFIKRM